MDSYYKEPSMKLSSQLQQCLLAAAFMLAAYIAAPCITYGETLPHTPQEQADTIASTIMSPFCPGRLLRDCPSSLATELRDTIKTRIEQGESADAVTESLIALYGESLRAAPRFSQFGIVGWIAPFAFLLLGLGAIGIWLKALKKPASALQSTGADSPPLAPLPPDLQSRVDRALRSHE